MRSLSRYERQAQQLKESARVVGVSAVTAIAQLAVDMPHGYFGPAGEVTPLGGVFVATEAVLASAACYSLMGRRRWSTVIVPLLLSVNIGLFFPALTTSPLVAAVVVIWNLILLGRVLLPPTPVSFATKNPMSDQDPDLEHRLVSTGDAARHLLAVALIVGTAVLGYGLGDHLAAWSVCLTLDILALALATPVMIVLFRRGIWSAGIAAVFAAAALASAPWPHLALMLLNAAMAISLMVFASRTQLFGELLQTFFAHPALLMLVSFVILIAVGSMLLTFPIASPSRAISPIDAVFTATSASCVTGLIVLDTPHDFTLFGQAVILGLIQVGGLNIMVLSAFAASILGRTLGLRGEYALGEVLDLRSVRSAYRLISFVVATTVAVELLGAIPLCITFLRKGLPASSAIWSGVFHSVSAFCNAGFSLESDSLVSLQHNPLALVVVAALITLGGLGFAVLASTWLRLRGHGKIGLAAQVRIVLVVSAALTVGGWLLYAVAEWHRTLGGLDVGSKIINALFQSVTCRTAGFNSVDLGSLHPVSALVMMVLMTIGASPGGTGGGIKTTTVLVLLSALSAIASGRPRVIVMRRFITLDTVFRSAAIAVVAVVVITIGAGALLASQQQPFETLFFEVVSDRSPRQLRQGRHHRDHADRSHRPPEPGTVARAQRGEPPQVS
jgi:trk system potassium uptake protein TrkH